MIKNAVFVSRMFREVGVFVKSSRPCRSLQTHPGSCASFRVEIKTLPAIGGQRQNILFMNGLAQAEANNLAAHRINTTERAPARLERQRVFCLFDPLGCTSEKSDHRLRMSSGQA